MSFGQGQGGGWGQGGGFGQPPGGGGGFGPPGGGGFGPPPGGGGFGPGGFGQGQPPPGGGEQPLARIPFSREDEANLMGAARMAKMAGIASVASAMINMGVGVLSRSGGGGLGGMVGIVVAIALAILLWRAADALEKVATTDHADQHHLMAALRELRSYFMVRGIVYIVGTVLVCCCGALLVAFGAAIFGLLANAR